MLTAEKMKRLLTVALACAVIFVIIFAIVNSAAISSFFSALLSVFAPIILGGAIAYMLNPLLKLFEFKIFKGIKNTKLLRALSLIMTYIIALLLIAAFLWLIIPSLIQSIKDLTANMDIYLDSTVSLINSFVVKLTKNDNFENLVSTETAVNAITNFFSTSGDIFNTVMDYVIKYGKGLIVGLKNVLLGLFISVYILLSKERLKAQCKKLSAAAFKAGTRKRLYRYFRIAHRTFGGFFVGKTIDSLIILGICLIVFPIAKIPLWPLISVIVGATNIIPFFGPFIGAIPSFFIIFIYDPKKALIFAILVLVIQQIDGNIIGPKILGNSTGISSLGVIVAIVIMGEYFGIIGMIVGVPIFATLTAIIEDLINVRLRKAELPTDVAEYYTSDSLVDPYEPHETVSQKAFNATVAMFKRVASLFRKKKSSPKVPSDKQETDTVKNNSHEDTSSEKTDEE